MARHRKIRSGETVATSGSNRRAAVQAGAGSPIIAVAGRPNVGKSTLFNRLTGSRRALVGDEPGMTRDRIYGTVEWEGRLARVVDTGGILPNDPDRLLAAIFHQAQAALQEASVVVMVVDGRHPLTAPDYDLAHILFTSGKPVVLAINKMDTGKPKEMIADAHRLGFREVYPISAEHGTGISELLDHIFALPAMNPAGPPPPPETEEEAAGDADGPERTHGEFRQVEIPVAIIGRPNVGKSTLLNAVTRSSRAIISPVPGTTRDAIDEVIQYGSLRLRLIDTAGIRRKGKTRLMAEKLSVMMARRHLETADVALLVLDATAGVTAADATIGGYAHESGRSVIVVVNKWDLVNSRRTDGRPPADKEVFERQLRASLKYLDYAPVIFVSAAEGDNISALLRLIREVALERRKRITTGKMNQFLERVDFERAGVPLSRKMRILYMTQAAVAPPTFILFTNRQAKLHFSFERFLVHQIRSAFGFRGSPIWLKVRARRDTPLRRGSAA